MNVLIAIDSFKGSLTSADAGNAVKCGILRAVPEADCLVRPLADGGEGTVDALSLGMGGKIENITVTGPLGKPVKCRYGIIADLHTAVVEMSAAAGITLIPEEERNPLYTTTYGVGEMIRDAILKGCREFIIGIGGSATNDGGTGMLQALGYGLLDKDGCQIRSGAIGLKDLASITTDNVIPELSECTFKIACDVTNPLCGEKGCSAVYGPQKGADPEMIEAMDGWLDHYAGITKIYFPDSDAEYPGTGAAGGMGFAFMSFTDAILRSGVSLVLEETGLEEHIRQADIVITGEGRLDSQTVMGKAPIGVALLAKKYKKLVIAFSGCVSQDASVCNESGIDAFFPIVKGACSIDEAMEHDRACGNLSDTAEQVFRLIRLYSNC